MPELPEVETVRRGLESVLGPQPAIAQARRNRPDLRIPIPRTLPARLAGQPIIAIERRAKLLLWRIGTGTLINHLGMTGSWRIREGQAAKHDHFELTLTDDRVLVYADPRRFGLITWTDEDPHQHPLLGGLGPEPLSDDFDVACLAEACRGRKAAIKQVIMSNAVVVGVGNIYAAESLFRAGIDPRRPAGRISRERLAKLVTAIKTVLAAAIEAGGSTIRDFRQAGGSSGYFQHDFRVYGRAGEACRSCGATLKGAVIGQRASTWCPRCQR